MDDRNDKQTNLWYTWVRSCYVLKNVPASESGSGVHIKTFMASGASYVAIPDLVRSFEFRKPMNGMSGVRRAR